MDGATWNCYCLSAPSVYIIQPFTSLQCHFIPIARVTYVECMCLAVTCYLHCWLLAECCFTSTETVGLIIRDGGPGRPPRLSHSSWALHFWQMTRAFTCYCGNTGVERIRIKSQHRKLTLEKKIRPPLLRELEPSTFQSRVRLSNHCAFPAPRVACPNHVNLTQFSWLGRGRVLHFWRPIGTHQNSR